MTSFLRWSAAAYGKLLILYPEELRREFAAEISLVFDEDVADAWRERGAVGVSQVWWCALCEVMRIALPSQFANPDVAVPVIAFALNIAMLGAELVLASRHAPATAVHGPLLRDAIRRIVLLPSAAHAIVAFAVVRLSRFNPPTSLSLAHIHGHVGTEGSAGRA